MEFIVDNKAGILENEKTVLDVFVNNIERAIKENKKLSFYIAVGFFFFEGFQKLYPHIKKLYEKNLLKDFKLVMGPETRKTTKEILQALKTDASNLDEETFKLLKRLYEEKKFDFRIFFERSFHLKMYMFDLDNEIEVWAGSANLTEAGLEENIELIVPALTTRFEEKEMYRKFFDEIWKRSTDEVENLKIIEVVEKSVSEPVTSLSLRSFILNLIKIWGKDYLIKNVSADFSYLGEFQVISYYIILEKLREYGGCILANSYGLGKTDVACAVAKYYKELGKKVLIIHPPVLKQHWVDTLKKVGIKEGDVELLSRGLLQKSDFDYEKYSNIDLIIVDEAHHFRVVGSKSNRRENLEKICKNNPNSHVLLITATPINISLTDLTNLIKLFIKGNYKTRFESEGLINKIKEIEDKLKISEENVDLSVINALNDLIIKFAIRIDWSDILRYFSEDLKKISGKEKIEPPIVYQVKYKYDEEVVRNIFDNVVPFLKKLKFEYTKLWEEEYKEDKNLIWWYKWRLYKRLESSLFAFEKSLESFLERNKYILSFLEEVSKNKNYFEETNLFDKERLNNIKNTFLSLSKQKREKVLKNIRFDIEVIEDMLKKIKSIKDLYENDQKVRELIKILKTSENPVIVFSESVDTVVYLARQLKKYTNLRIQVAHGKTTQLDYDEEEEEISIREKDEIQSAFNSGKIDVLVATDVMGEGVNLPGHEDKSGVTVINFDLPYNPVKLIQRDGRAIRINNPKKVYIYNFEPDNEIDKELELCETISNRVSNIISTIGIDFIVWAIEEGKIKNPNELLKKEKIKIIREYKDLLASKMPDEIKKHIPTTLSKEDKVLREFIKYLGISEESLEKVKTETLRKPLFIALERMDKPGYFILFEYKGNKYHIGELLFSEKQIEKEITEEEFKNINKKVQDKCDELDLEILKTPDIGMTKLDRQIKKEINKIADVELRKFLENEVDYNSLTKEKKIGLMKYIKRISESMPIFEIENKREIIKNEINEIIGRQKTEKQNNTPKILAVIKYG
jgi:superfamily II DNA/RNA helicase/HKD family nuclease